MALSLAVENDHFTFSGRAYQITKAKNDLLAPYEKQLLNYGVVITLLPSTEQTNQINRTIGCARVVHNDYLEARNRFYEANKAILSVSEYEDTNLKQLKKDKPYLNEVDKFALAAACENVDAAFRNFYEAVKTHGTRKKKNGSLMYYPQMASRFKPNGNVYTTKFTNNNIEISRKCLKLPKLGLVPYKTMGDHIGSVSIKGV